MYWSNHFLNQPFGLKTWRWRVLLLLLLATLLLAAPPLTSLAQGPGGSGMGIVKHPSRPDAAPGDIVIYTVEVFAAQGGPYQVLDNLNPNLEFLDSPFNPVYNADLNSLTFDANLTPGEILRLTYRARIKPATPCGSIIVNQAVLAVNADPLTPPAEAVVRVVCADLGDAPTSDNHFAMPMTAYPTTPAHFPTVFQQPPGVPVGPRHHNPMLLHLGQAVSFEVDADVGFDTDTLNNLLPPIDLPDQDRFDDGLLDAGLLNFADCVPTELSFMVYTDPALAAFQLDKAFLNVWFDGNRNGTWADVNDCGGSTGPVPEHIVIDAPVSLIPGFQTITVTTTVPVFNPDANAPGWLRATLSEQPSFKTGEVNGLKFGDGRGVPGSMVQDVTGAEYPVLGYFTGETEDYLLDFQPPPPLDPIRISKQVIPTTAMLGDPLAYSVTISNTSAVTQAVSMFDPIPDGTAYVPNSFTSTIASGLKGYVPDANAVIWEGELGPGRQVTVQFGVQVLHCPQPNDTFAVVNEAWVMGPSFGRLSSGPVETTILPCAPRPRTIFVEKVADPPVVYPEGQLSFELAVINPFTDTAAIRVTDHLNPGFSIDPNTLPPNLTFLPPNTIHWDMVNPSQGLVTTTFTVKADRVQCGERIINQAEWRAGFPDSVIDGLSNPVAIEVVCPDLGDAPDSDGNHHNAPNTAYFLPGSMGGPVAGHFPTVWGDTPAGQPSGPMHVDPTQAVLGSGVSMEFDADIGPDADGLNNILPFGTDFANNDRLDDGWLNRDVPLEECREATLKVKLTKQDPSVGRMFLNVWFDGNRDGDWDDARPCLNEDQRTAFEWLVQNRVIDMSNWLPGVPHDILVPTVLILNDDPDLPAWLRFTLSEENPPANPATGLPDGRGPDQPNHFQWGETEDYFIDGRPAGQPGDLVIEKTASMSPTHVGDVYTYSVFIAHQGGTAPAEVGMLDTLAPEGAVELAGPPVVTELSPGAAPLVAHTNGLNVGWEGWLNPGAVIRIDYPVRVLRCPLVVGRPWPDIRNEATLFPTQKSVVLEVPVVDEQGAPCQAPPPPTINLKKTIITDLNEPLTHWTTVPGEAVHFRLALSATTDITMPLVIEDPLPAGLRAVAAQASRGVAHLVDSGRAVVWEGEIGPALPGVMIEILVKLQEVECGREIVNQAVWHTPFHQGESNAVVLELACHDLGDAPDSLNFYGLPMAAYPGVPAHFPTTFTSTATITDGYGPIHLKPVPLHLGPRVSFEIEADIGLDLDGVNNIEPKHNKPNLDKADDGLLLDKLNFDHCRTATFPVVVSIGPNAAAMMPPAFNGVAHLNVWLDSNRDGDWADIFQCANIMPGENTDEALEHIVIDAPVDVAALGPGLHVINVTTTRPVFWPDDLADKPAWLRVTLSEKFANQPLPCSTGPNCRGDGRGYADGFLLGETEDYLIRGPQEPEQPDLVIEKEGFIFPFFEFDEQNPRPDTGQLVWYLNWPIHYKNAGVSEALNVTVTDTFADQDFVFTRSFPHRPFTVGANSVTYNLGGLAPGDAGHIFIQTRIPFTTPAGTVFTNVVEINTANDADPTNNTAIATVRVPLLPPRITYPRPGTTCTGTFTITGRAQTGGVLVDVSVDGTLVGTATVDMEGRWALPVTLADGDHVIQARTGFNGHTGPQSPPVEVIVDSTLFWDPLSLHFSTPQGFVMWPRDEDGRMDEGGWFVFLRPGQTYTATVRTCCDSAPAVTLDVPGLGVLDLTDPDGDGWYQTTFTMPTPGSGTITPGSTIRLCVTCNLVKVCTDGQVLIDPEGVVYDITQGSSTGLLDGANVTCYEAQTSINEGATTFDMWPATDFGQINPQTTATDGYFSFFTPAGTYQLGVSRDGYQDYRSPDLVVVDAPVSFDVPLSPVITRTAHITVTVSDAGFDPPLLTVAPGTVIEWLNVDAAQHTATTITPTVRAPAPADGWDSGLLNSGQTFKRQLDTMGTYTYQDSENPAYTAQIIVAPFAKVYLPLVLK